MITGATAAKKAARIGTNDGWFLILLFAVTLFAALLAAKLPGFQVDLSTFHGWAERLVERGLTKFYEKGVFADYFPAYLYVLRVIGAILHMGAASDYAIYILKLPGILALCALGPVAYHIADAFLMPEDRLGRRLAAIFFALNPALFYNCAIFGQVDTLLVLLVMLAILAAIRGQPCRAAFWLVLAISFKPLALVPGTAVGLVAFAKRRSWTLPWTLKALLTGAATAGVLFYPFWSGRLGEMLGYYREQFHVYPYVTVNGFNVYGALGWNWVPLSEPSVFGLSKGGLAKVLLLVGAASVLLFARARGLRFRHLTERQACGLAAALATTGYLLAPMMHERYFVIVFPLLAFLLPGSPRAGWALLISTLTLTIDQMSALDLYFGQRQAIGGFSPLFVASASLKLVVLVLFLIDLGDRAAATWAPEYRPWVRVLPSLPPLLPEKRWEKAFVALIIAVSTTLGFAKLGERRIPVSSLTKPSSWLLRFDRPEKLRTVAVFIQSGNANIRLGCRQTLPPRPADVVETVDGIREWKQLRLPRDCNGDLEVEVRSLNQGALGELAVFDSAKTMRLPNQICTLAGDSCTKPEASPLFDEPSLAHLEKNYMSETFFDEVYYVRAAHELLQGLPVSESTHPPAGKDLIAASVLVFGDNPLAWRLPTAVFGALIPVAAYLLARLAFGYPAAAVVAAILMLLDTGRVSMARIATLDVTVVFFLLGTYTSLIWYLRSCQKERLRSRLPPLVVAATFWGLAVATKWVGVYALPGILSCFGLAAAEMPGTGWRQKLSDFIHGRFLEIAVTFTVLPALIYVGSYVPLWLTGSLKPGITSVIRNAHDMFAFHSSILGEHPYSSHFYEWAWNQRPLLMAHGSDLENKQRVIMALGNPVLWGLVPVILALVLQRSRRMEAGSLIVGLAATAQLLPWVFIRRSTFSYHFLPTAAFGIVLLAHFASTTDRGKRWPQVVLVAATAIAFLAFWPLVSGWPVASGWVASLKLFDTWSF